MFLLACFYSGLSQQDLHLPGDRDGPCLVLTQQALCEEMSEAHFVVVTSPPRGSLFRGDSKSHLSTCLRTWPRWHPSHPLGQEAPRCKGRTYGITNLGDQRTAGPRARSQAGMSGSYCLVWCSCQSMGTFEAVACSPGTSTMGEALAKPFAHITSAAIPLPGDTLPKMRLWVCVPCPTGFFTRWVPQVHLSVHSFLVD